MNLKKGLLIYALVISLTSYIIIFQMLFVGNIYLNHKVTIGFGIEWIPELIMFILALYPMALLMEVMIKEVKKC